MWRVVIGKNMIVSHVKTHSYQAQLDTCRVIVQSYAKFGVPSIT